MCSSLKFSRGGYYTWLDRPCSKRAAENRLILERITDIYSKSGKRYGSPRIADELQNKGYSVSHPRVVWLMRRNGISAIYKKKFKVTTDSTHNYPVSANLLKQDFSTEQAGKVWGSDLTYIYTQEGWLYLTVIIDLYNRMIAGWAMSNSMRASETTIPALK